MLGSLKTTLNHVLGDGCPLGLRFYMPFDELMRSTRLGYEGVCALQAIRFIGISYGITKLLDINKLRDVRILTEARAYRSNRADGRRMVFVHSASAAAKVFTTFIIRNFLLQFSCSLVHSAMDYSRSIPIYNVPALAIRGLHLFGMSVVGMYGRSTCSLMEAVSTKASAATAAFGMHYLPRPMLLDHLVDGYLFSFRYVFARPYGVSRWFRLAETSVRGLAAGSGALTNTTRITFSTFDALSITVHDLTSVCVALHIEDYLSAVITYGVVPACIEAWRQLTLRRSERREQEDSENNRQPSFIQSVRSRWEFNGEVWAVRFLSRVVADLVIVGPILSRVFGPHRSLIRFSLALPTSLVGSSMLSRGVSVVIPTAVLACVIEQMCARDVVASLLEGLYRYMKVLRNEHKYLLSIVTDMRMGQLARDEERLIEEALGLDVAASIIGSSLVDMSSPRGDLRREEQGAMNVLRAFVGANRSPSQNELRAAEACVRHREITICNALVLVLTQARYDAMTDAQITDLYNFVSVHVIDQNPPIASIQFYFIYLCYALRQLEALDPKRMARRKALIMAAVSARCVSRLNVANSNAPLLPLDFGDDVEVDGIAQLGDESSETRPSRPQKIEGSSHSSESGDKSPKSSSVPNDNESGADVCAVCLREISTASTPDVCQTMCNHLFHTACLAESLVAGGSCPMCKAYLLRPVLSSSGNIPTAEGGGGSALSEEEAAVAERSSPSGDEAPVDGNDSENQSSANVGTVAEEVAVHAAGGDSEQQQPFEDFVPPSMRSTVSGLPYSYTLARSVYRYNMPARTFFTRALQAGVVFSHWGCDMAMLTNYLEGRILSGGRYEAPLLSSVVRGFETLSASRLELYTSSAWEGVSIFGRSVPTPLRWIYQEVVNAHSRSSFFYVGHTPVADILW